MKRGVLKLIYAVAFICFSHSSVAALLDFTDSSLLGSLTPIANGYSGSIDGVGFTLTSTSGAVNFTQNYDGSAFVGCQAGGGALKCDKDGVGIDLPYGADDEITGVWPGIQKLTLSFDQIVKITGFHFLDLYLRPDGSGRKEQATISVDGAFFATVDAIESHHAGGYADLVMGSILAQTLEFTADPNWIYRDDCTNDYALAGVDVHPVPLPPALWLFGSALVGLFGSRRAV